MLTMVGAVPDAIGVQTRIVLSGAPDKVTTLGIRTTRAPTVIVGTVAASSGGFANGLGMPSRAGIIAIPLDPLQDA